LLKQLIHNGVLVPESPAPVGLDITARGRRILLTPAQEEMALAWARKKDTPYVKDPVFAANFMRDFSAALGIEPPLSLNEVDFGKCYAYVDKERAEKEARSKEERKTLAAERKAEREALKAQYGHAIVNGQRVELGTYMTEPSGIFMGRGEHPLRGRWKEGAHQRDITLNLSPDAPPVEGDWEEIVWQPESLWVARWKDKLADKMKYIWLSDTAPIKQTREALKFDKAIDLEDNIEVVRRHIEEGLVDERPRRRMIATAAYLIDALCLRVGDEKDPDEADTVGATTLRPEHITLHDDGSVEFDFLGKDSVRWHKTIKPPRVVCENLAELIRDARPSNSASNGDRGHPTRDLPQIFPDVTSRDVNVFLSGIMPGLTAKVFRTHHATMAVSESLAASGAKADHPEYVKWQAANLANLEAAVLCSHTKAATGNWAATRERYQERQESAEERMERYRQQVQETTEALSALRQEARQKREEAATPEARRKIRERYAKRIERAQARLDAARQRRSRASDALGKVKAQSMIAGKKRTWNLGTSLRSYIDPRVYVRWGENVNYDVLEKYYPSTLRRRFAWVRFDSEHDHASDVQLRNCMSSDLVAVAQFFRSLESTYNDLDLPADVAEIEARFLPSLEKDWQEAVVALGEESEVVAFGVVGPAWEHDGEMVVDVVALVRPEWRDAEFAEMLAADMIRRVEAYRMLHPRLELPLLARDEAWFHVAPEVRAALGLGEEDLEPEEKAEGEFEPQEG
jgi:DNA topoisomerase-1